MPFYGDTIGAYMLPRVVLELLQQPNTQQKCGVSADSGFAWLLAGKEIYVWRYREGKSARLRVLTLPRQPAQPCHVAILADGFPSGPSGVLAPTGPSAAGNSLMVAVCDADGRLTVWLDAHHLSSPSEHLLLTPDYAPSVPTNAETYAPLAVAFAAARLDLGPDPALLVALSAADGSLHMVKIFSNAMKPTVLVAAQPRQAENRGLAATLGTVLGFMSGLNSRYVRKVPAAKPAVALHLAPMLGAGGMHYRLLVLSEDCLDCWAINAGNRPSESLQWSFSNCVARQHDTARASFRTPVIPLVNVDMAVGVGEQGAAQRVAVWIAEPASPWGSGTPTGQDGKLGTYKQNVLQVLEVHPDGLPEMCSGVNEVVLGYPESADRRCPFRRKLLYAPQTQVCLLASWERSPFLQMTNFNTNSPQDQHLAVETTPHWVCRTLWTWTVAPEGTGLSLADDPDTAAVDVVATAGGKALWVVFSATYGIMEVAALAMLQGREPISTDITVGGGGGLDAGAVITNLLDAVLSQAAAVTAASGNLQPLVSGLRRRLDALGALDGSILADYSTQLLDMLPKQWAAGSTASGVIGGGAGGAVSVPMTVTQQLADKEMRHTLLLRCLSQALVLPKLSLEVHRVLIENAEKLMMAVTLHRLQASQQLMGNDASQGPMSWNSFSGDLLSANAQELLATLVTETGRESSSREYEVLSPTEIFYARPSTSMIRFWETVGRLAADVREQATRGSGKPGDSDINQLRSKVRELGYAMPQIMQSVLKCRGKMASLYGLDSSEVARKLGRPDWVAGKIPRTALRELAAATYAVRPSPLAPFKVELAHSLIGVMDMLLSYYSSAINAVAHRDPEARSLLMMEYREIRSRYGPALFEDALAELRMGGWGYGQSPGPLKPDMLICHLEMIFRDHHCYSLLFDVCEELAAVEPALADRLELHMSSLPPEDPDEATSLTMAKYVFQRLLADGRPADLLALKPRFHSGITSFLQTRLPAAADLLAVQLLKNEALGDAAAVLMQGASTRTRGVGGAAGAHRPHPQQHHGDSGGVGPVTASLGSSRRLLSLARLAARASGAAEHEAHVVVQLKLLELQFRLGLSVQNGPLDPAIVLEEALAKATGPARSDTVAVVAAKEAAVGAVEVYTLMDARARGSHTSKWQVAWKAVYGADLWDEVAAMQVSTVGDEEKRTALQDTAVCRAARLCAHGETLGFGANVVDSAPLNELVNWLRAWAEADTRTSTDRSSTGSGEGDPEALRAERRKHWVVEALLLGLGTRETAAPTQVTEQADMMLE